MCNIAIQQYSNRAIWHTLIIITIIITMLIDPPDETTIDRITQSQLRPSYIPYGIVLFCSVLFIIDRTKP